MNSSFLGLTHVYPLMCLFVGHWKQSDEPVALKCLRNFSNLKRGFHLVPEHVETRSLFNPEKPGVEQVSQSYFAVIIVIIIGY